MIELTDEQRQQLQSGNAVDVVDQQTAQPYVVLRKDIYERVRNLLYDDSEWSDDELLAMLTQSSKDNGWEEPGMDAYDRYEATGIVSDSLPTSASSAVSNRASI